MMLGPCGLYIIQYMAKMKFIIYGQKFTLKPLAVLAMFLPFAYWSTQAFQKYLSEPVSSQSMVVKSEVKIDFPEMTFCLDTPFFEYLLAITTDDYTKHPNFHAALKAALKHDINLDLQEVNNSAYFDHPMQKIYAYAKGIFDILHPFQKVTANHSI